METTEALFLHMNQVLPTDSSSSAQIFIRELKTNICRQIYLPLDLLAMFQIKLMGLGGG